MEVDRRERMAVSESAKEQVPEVCIEWFRCGQFIEMMRALYPGMRELWAKRERYCYFKAVFGRTKGPEQALANGEWRIVAGNPTEVIRATSINKPPEKATTKPTEIPQNPILAPPKTALVVPSQPHSH